AVPLPVDPATRARIAAMRARVQELRALRLGGKYKDVLARLQPIVAETDAIGYLPLQVEALDELNFVQASLRSLKARDAPLHRLIDVASRAKDDARVARAWADLIALVGMFEDRPDEALALRPAAEAALERAGESDELRAQLLVAIGEVELARHDY